MSTDHAALLRLAQHLASRELDHWVTARCELTADPGDPGLHNDKANDRVGRCSRDAVGVRWEDGFCDAVCEEHGEAAVARGAMFVRARGHDGTLTP